MNNLILVTGSEGLVGSRFLEISEFKKNLHPPKQVELDITKPAELKAVVSSYNFTAIVNFAAFTDVTAAEKQRGDKNADCWQVNVEGVRNLVAAVKPHSEKVHFIQISTDMVFPGSKEKAGPYFEDYEPETDENKLSWYGFTKAEAERIVKKELGEAATILRLIYPVRAKFEQKPDFLRNFLKKYDDGELPPLFTDQQISIAFIDEACMALDKIISARETGIFHASSSDTTTPYKMVSYLLENARNVKNVVKATTLAEYLKTSSSSAYRYPKYGGLKVEKTQKRLKMNFSNCHEIVDELVGQGIG
jgi:dTDP-4-dehydrorhamnose reductase